MPHSDLRSGVTAPRRTGRRIYTVPHGTPFLTALARALLSGDLPVPGGERRGSLDLAGITLLLPTRRDIRALQDAFLEAAEGRALLLPRIKLISNTDDDSGVFLEAQHGDLTGEAGKPAIDKLEQELTLARLVMQWSDALGRAEGRAATRTPAQAVLMARELARLMDQVEMEDVDLTRLASLVTDEYSAHWAQTLDFLKIVTEVWPGHLDERNRMSRAGRRKRLMLAEAERLRTHPPRDPVIVAGVTGTVPAATELMRAVLELENGALVLPAIDRTLDGESWTKIAPGHPEHPQFGLKKLLDALGAGREDIETLPGARATAEQETRWAFVCQAMRPAATTEHWHTFLEAADKARLARATANWTLLEAPAAAEEAEAAALILREAAEHPGKTAMLVTPDRGLARRVSVRLKTWNLHVPDLADQPLGSTDAAVFLDLLIGAAGSAFAPVPLIALLKHPFCRLGLTSAELSEGARVLELAVLRAPYLGYCLADIQSALDRAANNTLPGGYRGSAVRRIGDRGWQAARRLAGRLIEALRPLEALFEQGERIELPVLAQAHMTAAERLAEAPEGSDGPTLWEGDGGERLGLLLRGLIGGKQPSPPQMAAADYPEFYRSFLADKTLAPRRRGHPRISIRGPLEARLQQADIVVLGSLNEGTWPQVADPGPWFNRAMREELGLPAPEQRIGEAAHDFASLLGADQVYLMRAAKIDGAPTVPSRWLLRLQVLLGGIGKPASEGSPWLAWAAQRNRTRSAPGPVPAPEPRPAVALRPRSLSVTDVEKWLANPYAIFAARILGLDPLPPLGRSPDAALRGQIVHDALRRFARRFPGGLPDDVAAELQACAQEALADLTGSPRVAAFWAPRLARFTAWFAETEPDRRHEVAQSLAELDGKLVLEAPAGPFTLRARADRIDVGPDGLIVTDYKTSSSLDTLVRSAKAGRAPQLPLEAAIAAAGGFAQVTPRQVAKLRYISAAGGKPPGIEQDLAGSAAEAEGLARQALDGLKRLVAEFDSADVPYRALRRARFRYDYDDYAHLARVAEWSIENDEEAA